MRKSRQPGGAKSRVLGHVLISSRRGVNRYTPGKYVCSCGTVCTGQNAFESHRAEEGRKLRGGE